MCYNPRRIVNPSTQFDEHCDALYLNVPCGKCGQCRSSKQKEYELRAYYEYLNTVKQGGFVLFDTFTYNPEHVPVHSGILSFDSRDYVLFMVNLRSYLIRGSFKDEKQNDLPASQCLVGNWDVRDHLKVLWSSEYGGTTYRPHYHALFFVTIPDMTPEVFDRYVGRAWKKGIRDMEHTVQERVVNGQGAISYVSKYINKDIDFEEVFTKQRDAIQRKELEAARLSDDPFAPLKIDITDEEDMKYIRPFHRQSKGFGECIKDMCSFDDIERGRVLLRDEDVPEGFKEVKVPQYIDRKLFYDYDPETKCFRLNEKGFEMKKRRFTSNVEYVQKFLESVFYNLSQYFTSESLPILRHYGASSIADLEDFMRFCLHGHSLRDVALYSILYKDRMMDCIDADPFAMPIDVYALSLPFHRECKSFVDFDNLKEYEKLLCNDFVCFDGFDTFLEIVHLLNGYHCRERQRNYMLQHSLDSQYKGFYFSKKK